MRPPGRAVPLEIGSDSDSRAPDAAGRTVEWLFPSENWTFITYRNSARTFYTVCAEAQLSGRSQYDLRHSYASLLLSKCAAPGYVQKQMGHKTLDMTLRVYADYVKVGDVRYCELLCRLDSTGIVAAESLPTKLTPSPIFAINQASPRSSVG